MRDTILCLLLCLVPSGALGAQEPPAIQKGSGPGGWLGVDFYNQYLGLSIGYPLVQRGGQSLGVHLGFGEYPGSNAGGPYPDGLKDKSGMNLGLYLGGKVFCAAGIERLTRTDSHRVFANYQTSSYDTTQVRTSGYLLLGYRSWPGFGIYVQGGGALGIGAGVSFQL